MPKNAIRKTLLAVPILLLAYLAIAALWAYASIDQLMAAAPAPTVLSERQQAILLQIEDPGFYTHSGLSVTDGQGVTTISSAIARDVFLEQGNVQGLRGALQQVYRAVFACCKKVDIGREVMALVLDAKVSKQRQLAWFAGRVYMGSAGGSQIRGLDLASTTYFGKALAELPEADFIGLVSMIKAPNTFHRLRQPAAYDQRRARVAAIVAGTCRPAGWFDTSYEHCR